MSEQLIGSKQTGVPSSAQLQTILESVRQLADEASAYLCAAFGSSTAVRKFDGSLVTEADRAVNRLFAERITTLYPDHAVLSEEEITSYTADTDFTWVIDPLDGTTNFARGLPIWGMSVALLFDGHPVVGVLTFPLLHEEYWAIRGNGAFLNGLPIVTSTLHVPDDQYFVMTCTRTPTRYRVDTPLKARTLGSSAYHVAAVAAGAAVAGFEATPKVWDLAAALLILEEAGGCYTSLVGSPPLFPLPREPRSYQSLSYPLLTAANPVMLNELRAAYQPIHR